MDVAAGAFHNVNGENIVVPPFHCVKGMTMFSQWFSAKDRERYLTSPHKRRIDHIGSSLLELRYASEVMRQHLHETASNVIDAALVWRR